MKKLSIGLVILLVVVCGVGGLAMRAMSKAKSAEAATKDAQPATVTRGELVVKVIDTGTIDAVKAVEVKSRASGRLARLLVDEGDMVTQGQLVAVIDPKETQLQVDQNRAQIRGAESGAARTAIEIEQRKISARASYQQAIDHLEQVKLELKSQPKLTSANIESARAALNSAKKELERMKSSVNPNARTAAESNKKEAEANYDNAKHQYQRQQDLEAKGFTSSKSVEDAKLQLDLAKTRLDAANDNYSRIDSQLALDLEKSEDEVRRAEANYNMAMANSIQDLTKKREYQSAVADVEKAKVAMKDVDALMKGRDQNLASIQQMRSVLSDSMRQLGETEIRSPINGIVSKKLVQEGELVASLSSFSSGTPILRIEDRTALRVMLNINEIDVEKLAQGMRANVDVDAVPGKSFAGTVKRIAPASTTTGQTQQSAGSDNVVKYAVEIWLKESDPRLRSGMSAKCTLEVVHKKGSLQLPLEYVGRDESGYYVMIAPPKKTDKPTKQAVTLGESTGSMYEVLTGVTEGMKVVRPEYKGPARQGFMGRGGPDGD